MIRPPRASSSRRKGRSCARGRRKRRGLRGILDAHAGRKKEHGKLTGRIAVALTSCRRCGNGFVGTTLLSGQGDKIVRTEIGRHPAGPGLVNELLQGSRSAA